MGQMVSDARWKALFSADSSSYKFENLGFSMMVARLSRRYKKEPSSLEQCIREAESFCQKYGRILSEELSKIA